MYLDSLPAKDGFRMRGEAITRLEAFLDAAFAFAVTLLVVSFGIVMSAYAPSARTGNALQPGVRRCLRHMPAPPPRR